MPANAQKAQALIKIMQGQYEEIRVIESEYRIFGNEGDYRPRIEFYHDAVRSYTSGQSLERLTVERLSYDISMLRHIQERPLHAGRSETHYSPSVEVNDPSSSHQHLRPPREVRSTLRDLYRDYTVLFAALFAEHADRDSRDREEEIEQLIHECRQMKEGLVQFQHEQITIEQLTEMLNHLENDDLYQAVYAVLQQKQKQQAMDQAVKALEQMSETMKQELERVQRSSTRFAMDQLAIYENSKETIKKLNAQGMNIAGKFVQQSLQQGHGQGLGCK